MSIAIDDLNAELTATLTKYRDMRAKAQTRMAELAAEKAKLEEFVGNLNKLLGESKPEAAPKATRGKRNAAPTAKKTRKARTKKDAAPAASGDDASGGEGSKRPRLDYDAITATTMNVIKTRGPISIKDIVATIQSSEPSIRGVRYDTISAVIAEQKDKLASDGKKPRLYSIAG